MRQVAAMRRGFFAARAEEIYLVIPEALERGLWIWIVDLVGQGIDQVGRRGAGEDAGVERAAGQVG